MTLTIKAEDKKCMEYVLANLEDLQERARLKGTYSVEGKMSGINTEVRIVGKDIEIESYRG